MSQRVEDDQWVWVVVENPGKNEKFLGQHDQDRDVSFIPVFLGKGEAEKGMAFLQREVGAEYEPQAIMYSDLKGRASENGFLLLLLNGSGQVLDRQGT